MICMKIPHTLLHPFFMEKELESSKILSEPKTPKRGYIKGVKGEGGHKEGGYRSSHFST